MADHPSKETVHPERVRRGLIQFSWMALDHTERCWNLVGTRRLYIFQYDRPSSLIYTNEVWPQLEQAQITIMRNSLYTAALLIPFRW
jgi:hypothetical protein